METAFQRTAPSSGGLRSHIRRTRPQAAPAVPDNPPAARPIIPAAPAAPKDDFSAPWRPYGRWDSGEETKPVRIGAGSDGITILSLRFRATTAVQQDINAISEQEESETRHRALADLRDDETWRTYLSTKSELQSAQARVAELEKRISDLDSEKQRIETSPRGKGARLIAIDKEREELAERLEESRAELTPLEVLFQSAEVEVQEQAKQAAQTAAGAAAQHRQSTLEALLADFANRHEGELTRILAYAGHSRGMNHDSRVRALTHFLFAAAQREPLSESATKSATASTGIVVAGT